MKAWQSSLIALFLIVIPHTGFTAHVKPERFPVAQRPHPELDANGGHIGAWVLYPSVQILESFDSNIYAAENRKRSDFVSRVIPQLKLNALNAERGVNASLSADHGSFLHNSQENFDDYKAVLTPFLNITHAVKLNGNLTYEKNHEQRSDPDAVANNVSTEPVTYDRSAAQLGLNYKRGRMGYGLAAERAYIDFSNNTAISGQTLINDDRNRFENNVTADLRCDFTDQSAFYWAASWLNRDYQRPDYNAAAIAYNGAERDSNGAQSVLGLVFPLTPLIALDGNAGFRYQNFSDNTYKDVHTAVGKFALVWLLTPMTTIDIGGDRQVFETNQTGASAYVQSSIGSTISHELRRDIILQASTVTGRNRYIGLNRNDAYRSAGAAAIYKMNRYLHWRLAYAFEKRNSNITAASFDRQRVFLSAQVQF